MSVGANTSSVACGVGGWLAAGRPFSTSAIASVASGPGAGVYPGGDEAWGDVDCVLHLRLRPGADSAAGASTGERPWRRQRQRPVACRMGLVGALPVHLRRDLHSREAMPGAEWSTFCLAAGFGCA